MPTSADQSKCRLCLQEGAPLRDSHFIPKAIYKKLTTLADPNPLLMTSSVIMPTSKQWTCRLLCDSCEQVLSDYGECSIIPLLANIDGSFPLRQLLLDSPNAHIGQVDDSSFYDVSMIEGLPQTAFIHFAIGILWRASQVGWKNYSPISLGPYEEKFREFLCGGASPLNSQSILMVMVNSDIKDALQTIVLPKSYRAAHGALCHEFRLPGIRVQFLAGYRLSRQPWTSFACFAKSNRIVLTPDRKQFTDLFGPIVRQIPPSQNKMLRRIR